MHCFVINAHTKTIVEAPNLADSAAIAKHIGFDSIDSDEIDGGSDRLYFDDSCFIRNQPTSGRFKLDSLAPVAGIGVIVGVGSDGGQAAPKLSLSEVRARIVFIA
jgi:hypothetical protein